MKYVDYFGIQVKVVRKRIKNMYLRVNKNGEFSVSAPVFLSDENIRDFVLSKKDWIEKAAERVENRVQNTSTYDEGEERTFFGKKYILHTDTTRKSGYYFKGNDIVICVGENSTVESRKKVLVNCYRDAMEQILPDISDECQEKSGLHADEWRIRDMKTRWGSCNTKEKRIWISLWLVEKPLECLKAVVYHELAHLKVKGHNKDFYALLEKICPNYHEAERYLKN